MSVTSCQKLLRKELGHTVHYVSEYKISLGRDNDAKIGDGEIVTL